MPLALPVPSREELTRAWQSQRTDGRYRCRQSDSDIRANSIPGEIKVTATKNGQSRQYARRHDA